MKSENKIYSNKEIIILMIKMSFCYDIERWLIKGK